MRLLATVLAALAVALLAAPSSAQAQCEQRIGKQWSGLWQVGTSHKDDKGRTVKDGFGQINLLLTPDEITLVGVYQFSGGGTLVSKLNERCGIEMSGFYNDATGPGEVRAKLDIPDLKSFTGKYWPCRPRYGCASKPWWGLKFM
jgi:opacity protein-like surface antigen